MGQIKAVTDNLPNSGALTDLATAAALATVATYIDTEVAAIKVTTDKLDDTLEDDAGTYRFTENALEQAPSGGAGGGDATEAKQDLIITAVNAILVDTDALDLAWADGGRLDVILDAVSGGGTVNISTEGENLSE